MKARRVFGIGLFVIACLAACEKSSSTKASGEMSAGELELFNSLPAGSTAVFGGNYMKLQNFMSSSLGQMTMKMTESFGKGMKEWMNCFVELKDLKLAGGVTFVQGEGELRMVFTGMTIDQLEGCAKKAGFPTTKDADGKFIGIEIPSVMGTQTQGYLAMPNGALYTRQGFAIAAMPKLMPAPRAELEADLAGLKQTVADDTKLTGLLAKVDRSKTIWFAGSGSGTPLGSKVADFYGSMDIDNGIAFDVTAVLAESGLAQQVSDGVAQVKKMSDQMPGEIKSIIEGLQFDRDGDKVRFALRLSDKQIKSVMSQAGGMLGGGFR